jgi:hypothetical protein
MDWPTLAWLLLTVFLCFTFVFFRYSLLLHHKRCLDIQRSDTQQSNNKKSNAQHCDILQSNTPENDAQHKGIRHDDTVLMTHCSTDSHSSCAALLNVVQLNVVAPR